MSYPKNLGTKLNYLTNYSTNSVKLNMDNSSSELQSITSGARLQFTLPPNSLVDLSSLSVHADFETTRATANGANSRPYYLTRNAMSMVKRLTIEIGGQVVSDIQDYNLINQIFSDYQFGIEGSSKKLLSNTDPLLKYDTNGVQRTALGLIANADAAALILDKRPIVLSQFLGFLGGGAGIKYIDTQLTGTIKITMELAPAKNILFRPGPTGMNGAAQLAAGDPNGNGDLVPGAYKLDKVYATIKKCSIDDGVYFASVASALQAGIPFEYKYNHFSTTKSGLTNGDLTMRYEIMSNSVDLALLTFYDSNNREEFGEIPSAAALGFNANATGIVPNNVVAPNVSGKCLALAGKMSCFSTKYFQRVGSHIDTTKFFINGERLPQYDMKNPQCYNQSLIDFGIHDDTANGIFWGINSYESWEQNYWIASARLSHVCNDDTFVSGFNANGVPLTLSVETTSPLPAVDKIGQLFVMTTEVLQVYSGRQVNRVK